MDPSSPYAMARMVGLKDRFDVAFASDTDADRHGIVSRSAGLLEPNHYLSVAIDYLFRHRAALVGRGRRRQDGREQQHDRPRGGAARTAARRGAGRVQVVRRRARARDDRLLRRGERRGDVPAPRRRPCGRRTRTGSCRTCSRPRSRRAPARTRASTTARSRPSSATPCYARIDAPATAEQKARLAALSPAAVTTHDARRRADHAGTR